MKLVEMNLDPDRKTLRQFGFIALCLFGLLGALVLWKRKFLGIELATTAPLVASVLWALGGLSGFFSLVAPRANRLLYVGLIVVTFPIGFVLSYMFMAIIFFVIFTPIGLFFRLIGRDPLRRRFDPKAATYYVPHREAENVERYFRQY
jgi:hypothetical protein